MANFTTGHSVRERKRERVKTRNCVNAELKYKRVNRKKPLLMYIFLYCLSLVISSPLVADSKEDEIKEQTS